MGASGFSLSGPSILSLKILPLLPLTVYYLSVWAGADGAENKQGVSAPHTKKHKSYKHSFLVHTSNSNATPNPIIQEPVLI